MESMQAVHREGVTMFTMVSMVIITNTTGLPAGKNLHLLPASWGP
jgi:hypothetical protein